MNAPKIDYQGISLEYVADYGRTAEAAVKPRRRRNGQARRGNRISAYNGIHRRRSRRWSW